MRVQTAGGTSTDRPYTPVDAIGNALRDLRVECNLLREKLNELDKNAFETDDDVINRPPVA